MSAADKPSDDAPAGPFLSRWSRRKVAARDAPQTTPAGPPAAAAASGEPAAAAVLPAGPGSGPDGPAEKTELPSIETLTADADFSPFMAKDVDPALRNQAMKKLFTDPHYGFDNMDKLDIYIDDYSRSDPIPLEILKTMYQAKSLFLFDDEEKPELGAAATPAVAAGGMTESDAQAVNSAPLSQDHSDSDAAIAGANIPEKFVDTQPHDSMTTNDVARDDK